MSIKLICCDVDGTLLSRSGVISDENIDAIKQCADHGVYFALASGRGLYGLQEVWKQLQIQGYSICYNGSCVYDQSYKLYDRGMSVNQTKEVITYLIRHNITALISTSEGDYVEETLYRQAINRNEHWIKNAHCIKAFHYEEILKEKHCIYKISLYMQNQAQANAVLQELKQTQIHFMYADEGFYDVKFKGHEKVDGVMALLYHLQLTKDEVLCIGDNENDMSMLRYAGVGVAMGNALDHVKECADVITLTNEDHGVAAALHSLVLENF